MKLGHQHAFAEQHCLLFVSAGRNTSCLAGDLFVAMMLMLSVFSTEERAWPKQSRATLNERAAFVFHCCLWLPLKSSSAVSNMCTTEFGALHMLNVLPSPLVAAKQALK